MKIYAYIVIAILAIGFIKWLHYEIDLGGYNRHKTEIADLKDDHGRKEKKQVDTLIGKKKDLKSKFKKEKKKIEKSKDSTGCADVKLIDMGFGL